ncbi:MAG: DTW domain-containing protein [Opitutaceae bacterium]
MARSVVYQSTVRCEHCRFTLRWCICAGFQSVDSTLRVDVLMHWREFDRPTSTGRLVNRVMSGSRCHLFRPGGNMARESIARPGRELLILHPRGESLPVGTRADQVQVLLLDGSWRESVQMAQAVTTWGRLVRLPAAGPSRNALRRQDAPGQYATVESLLFLLAALGLSAAELRLRQQFELHVYAGLRARGAKAQAEAFLATTSLRETQPELMSRLEQRRPN